MKPAPFSFVRPQGLQHALEALAADPGSKVLAGGQSLVPLLNMRLAAPSTLVDINGLPDLAHVRVDADGRTGRRAGPARRRARRRRRTPGAAAARARPRARRARHDPQPRHGRRVARARRRGRRAAGRAGPARRHRRPWSRPAGSRARSRPPTSSPGRWSRRCAHDEIAVEAFFPALGAGAGVGFAEIARRHGDYALCGVAAVVRVDGDAVVAARAGYLSVADVPTVVDLTGALGDGVTDASLAAAAGERAGAPRPGRRHPRDGGLPQPPGARAHRACPAAAYADALGASGAETMTEELHDVRLVVNGVAHDVRRARPAAAVRRAAPRPRPDRHPRRLRARRLRRLHGAGRRRPVRSCLMFAVSAVDARSPRSRGSPAPTARSAPVQQAFPECHGLQCGFCTPGFLTTITAGLRDQPGAHRGRGPRDGRRQPVPLHRLHQHRQGRCSAPPSSRGRRDRADSTEPEGDA